MPHMLIFGLGYTAGRLATRLLGSGWTISATGSAGMIAFDDEAAIAAEFARATHILSSVPPGKEGDPVLARYGSLIRAAPARWLGYLSSTGVYGDTGGAWVDETAPIGLGRRGARAEADLRWQTLRSDVWVFRLPGIYGPARSPLDRVRAGLAHRIDLPGQVFSRVHVDDIVGGVLASLSGPAGVYNLADDMPASQNDVVFYACQLLNMPLPPLLPLDTPGLSPAARAFYSEQRRVANGRAKRLLGWRPLYPSYAEGLSACTGTV